MGSVEKACLPWIKTFFIKLLCLAWTQLIDRKLSEPTWSLEKGPWGHRWFENCIAPSTAHSPWEGRGTSPQGDITFTLHFLWLWSDLVLRGLKPWGASGNAGAQTQKVVLVLKSSTYQQAILFPRMLRKHIMAHWLPPSNSQELILQTHTLGKTFPFASWRCHPGGS